MRMMLFFTTVLFYSIYRINSNQSTQLNKKHTHTLSLSIQLHFLNRLFIVTRMMNALWSIVKTTRLDCRSEQQYILVSCVRHLPALVSIDARRRSGC